jgi:hypothetical protein
MRAAMTFAVQYGEKAKPAEDRQAQGEAQLRVIPPEVRALIEKLLADYLKQQGEFSEYLKRTYGKSS